MKNTDNLSTTHFQIYDYWKNKYICRDGTITEDGSIEDCVPVVESDFEPVCWGCGKPIIGDYEKKNLENPQLELLWNDRKVKSKLNRCHIIPRALGGGVTAENLFLMCSNCHFYSPDTTNVEAFFRWVYKSKKEHVYGILHPTILMKKIEDEIQERGLPNTETLLKTIPKEKEKDFMSGSYREWFDKNVGLHCTNLAESSFVIGMADYIISEVNKCQG